MNMTTAPVDEPLPTGRLAALGLQRGAARAGCASGGQRGLSRISAARAWACRPSP